MRRPLNHSADLRLALCIGFGVGLRFMADYRPELEVYVCMVWILLAVWILGLLGPHFASFVLRAITVGALLVFLTAESRGFRLVGQAVLLGYSAALWRARVPHRMVWTSACVMSFCLGAVYGLSWIYVTAPAFRLPQVRDGMVELVICVLLVLGLAVRTALWRFHEDWETCCNCGYSLRGLPTDRCPECGHLNVEITTTNHPRLIKRRLPYGARSGDAIRH